MTADMDECIHGLGPVTACTICNGREARERAEANRVIYWFEARFDGTVNCDHSVEIGERLARMGDDSIRCERCAT